MYRWILIFAISLFLASCHKKISKQSVVYGRVYVYGSNTPLTNHTIYLYGSYGSSGTVFDYQMAETTTDGNGNYRFEYEVVDGVIPRQTWIPGSQTESFNETQVFNVPDFSQYNSCYVQGPPPNSSSYTLGYHTTVQHDVVLYPYAKLNMWLKNHNCFDSNDEVEFWLDSPLQQSGYGGQDHLFHGGNMDCDSSLIIQYIFNPTFVKWVVKRNGITTGPFHDTLTFNMCDEVNYEIEY